jgi:hypothetical protein
MIDPELKQALDAMEQRIGKRFDERFEEVYERMENTETSLLVAFKDWADAINRRVQSWALLDERVAKLESAIVELKVRIKPPQNPHS